MNRELILLDSEWSMVAHSDSSRFEQLLNSSARDGHPMKAFTWGNLESLKTEPDENGVCVHKELKRFHEEFYLAKNMTLVILSKDTLDDIERWTKTLFSPVPSNDNPTPSFIHLEPPFNTPNFRKLYHILPVKNICQLQVTWAMESQLRHYKKKPLTYLGSLLGHKGNGGLYALLRKRRWIRSIHSGNDETSQEHNSTWAQFSIRLSLTKEGLSHLVEVITMIYQYLKLLNDRGIKRWIWKEMNTIDNNDFQWIEPQKPQQFVHHQAINMQKYDTRDVITGRHITLEYDEALIRGCLEKLRPEEANISVWSKTFKDESDGEWLTERWFKTSYRVKDIPSDWINTWTNCQISPDLSLPEANIFIASDFVLKTPDPATENLKKPLSSSTVSRLFFQQSNDFPVPKAFIGFCLRRTDTEAAANICLLDMYVLALKHLTDAVGYPAKQAKLSYSVKTFDRGMTIQCYGLSDKLPLLFVTLVDNIAKFQVSDEVFDDVCAELKDLYSNIAMNPERLAKELQKSILRTNYHSVIKKLDHLKDATKDQLQTFVETFYKEMFVEGITVGNMTAKEAVNLEAYLVKQLNVSPSDHPEELFKVRVTKLPLGLSTYLMKNQNEVDENNAIMNHYQFGKLDLHGQLISELLVDNLEEPFFDQLRSKLQLGYSLHVAHRVFCDITGFTMVIHSQASRFRVDHLDYFMEKFLLEYDARIQKTTKAEFDKMVAAMIKKKNVGGKNLKEEADGLWSDVLEQTYMGNDKNETDELQTITLDELKSWSCDHLKPNVNQRKLSIQIMGNKLAQSTGKQKRKTTKQRKKDNTSASLPFQRIADIDQFKKECDVYTYTRWE